MSCRAVRPNGECTRAEVKPLPRHSARKSGCRRTAMGPNRPPAKSSKPDASPANCLSNNGSRGYPASQSGRPSTQLGGFRRMVEKLPRRWVFVKKENDFFLDSCISLNRNGLRPALRTGVPGDCRHYCVKLPWQVAVKQRLWCKAMRSGPPLGRRVGKMPLADTPFRRHHISVLLRAVIPLRCICGRRVGSWRLH